MESEGVGRENANRAGARGKTGCESRHKARSTRPPDGPDSEPRKEQGKAPSAVRAWFARQTERGRKSALDKPWDLPSEIRRIGPCYEI